MEQLRSCPAQSCYVQFAHHIILLHKWWASLGIDSKDYVWYELGKVVNNKRISMIGTKCRFSRTYSINPSRRILRVDCIDTKMLQICILRIRIRSKTSLFVGNIMYLILESGLNKWVSTGGNSCRGFPVKRIILSPLAISRLTLLFVLRKHG